MSTALVERARNVAAGKIAEALEAEKLLLLTDVEGVRAAIDAGSIRGDVVVRQVVGEAARFVRGLNVRKAATIAHGAGIGGMSLSGYPVRTPVVDLVEIGAYRAGTNERLDRALALVPRIETFLRQDVGERSRLDDTLACLEAIFATPAPSAATKPGGALRR